MYVTVARNEVSYDIASSSSLVDVCKCSTNPANNITQGKDNHSLGISSPAGRHHNPFDFSYNTSFSLIESCLDAERPLSVILVSLGRTETDATWKILKELTGTEVKAVEIVCGNEEETIDFFQSLEGLRTNADTWELDETFG